MVTDSRATVSIEIGIDGVGHVMIHGRMINPRPSADGGQVFLIKRWLTRRTKTRCRPRGSPTEEQASFSGVMNDRSRALYLLHDAELHAESFRPRFADDGLDKLRCRAFFQVSPSRTDS